MSSSSVPSQERIAAHLPPSYRLSPAPHVYSDAAAYPSQAIQASAVRRYSKESRVVAHVRVPRHQHLFRRVVVSREVPALFG